MNSSDRINPLCPVFGECGGCQYQDIPYGKELQLKEQELKDLFQQSLAVDEKILEPVVPSPKQYHYRSRLDLKLLKTKSKEVFMGFSPAGRRNRVLPVEGCPLAINAVSDFLPELKRQAASKLPERYRNANLVVKTGDDNRVVWGGIGRRSLQMREEDYLWTVIKGKKIFYSLDTFFQANLSILEEVISRIEALGVLNERGCLYDLYGGVGLFGICLYAKVKSVVLIEENVHAEKLAQYNGEYHHCRNFKIITGTVEEHFPSLPLQKEDAAIIDPPRAGLSPAVAGALARARNLKYLLYLSCCPETLVRDLAVLTESAWRVSKVIPFDFFPRTRHLEILSLLVNS